MTERRGWLWKKKLIEKLSSASDSTDSLQVDGCKQDNQEANDKQNNEQTEQTLSKQLSVALSDLASKESLLKQHAKVAEEAITGWEKAEIEAAKLTQKLDDVVQQKLAAEDRVLHLDGALKECMRQLRCMQDEHGQQIHDTVIKKTREWEKAHTELNLKLADFGSQLVEARAESKALSKSLQEKTRIIAEISKANALADADVKLLQLRLAGMEKENAKLKHEIHVLSKELEIQLEEQEHNKKAREAANKDYLENMKKIANLEAECERLRFLVRKRPSDPATFVQKVELETLSRENGERDWKKSSWSRNASSAISSANCASRGLFDTVVATHEDAHFQKRMQAKKEYQLQAACFHTAGKLLPFGKQLDSMPGYYGSPRASSTNTSKEANITSESQDAVSEDEISCAESWASALMAELAHFRKEKVDIRVDEIINSYPIDLMYDFSEMEKLASSSIANNTEPQRDIGKHKDFLMVSGLNAESESVMKSKKLTDEQVSASHENESKSAAVIACLKQNLLAIFKARANGNGLTEVLEEAKRMLEVMEDHKSKEFTLTSAENSKPCMYNMLSDTKTSLPWSSSSQLQESKVKEVTHVSTVSELKRSSIGPELVGAVHKVLELIKELAQAEVPFPHLLAENGMASASSPESLEESGNADIIKFQASIERLAILCQSLLQWKVDIIDFMVEIASTLDWLVGYIYSASSGPAFKALIRSKVHSGKESAINNDVASYAYSHVFQPPKLSDKQSPTPTMNGTCISSNPAFKDKILMEKEAFQTKFQSEIQKALSLEYELSQLKSEKNNTELDHKLTKEQLENMRIKLQGSQYQVKNVKTQLTTTLEKKEAMENNFTDLMHAKQLVESELQDVKNDMKQLQRSTVLQDELLEKVNSCNELQQHELIRTPWMSRENELKISGFPFDEGLKLQKDQTIASATEKLSECQTIALGNFDASKDVLEASSSSNLTCTQQICSSGVQMHCGRGSNDLLCTTIKALKEVPAYQSRNEHNEMPEHCLISGSQEIGLGFGGEDDIRCDGVSTFSNEVPDKLYKGNEFLSPVHMTAPLERVASSHARSPARFLNFKNRSSSKIVNVGNSVSSFEKHGSGLSRFFIRNRNGH